MRRGKNMFDRKMRKSGRFADLKLDRIDYKDERLLRKFTTERGKIIPRRVSGVSAKNQRRIKTAIKRARYMAILPFVEETFK
ncbi:MAG: 30S ribosomal protein S18 [candidate division Zixibacteria bacterium]|jgi:small subunit ribosomal protein S18|nr:30S ribosomal protein S18 [candidate division Zixibacteria bacterium]